MKKHSTKLMAVLLAAVMLLPLTVQAVPAEGWTAEAEQVYQTVTELVVQQVSERKDYIAAATQAENAKAVYALWTSSAAVPDGFYDEYLQALADWLDLAVKRGKTAYIPGAIRTVAAMGLDVTDLAGHDLMDALRKPELEEEDEDRLDMLMDLDAAGDAGKTDEFNALRENLLTEALARQQSSGEFRYTSKWPAELKQRGVADEPDCFDYILLTARSVQVLQHLRQVSNALASHIRQRRQKIQPAHIRGVHVQRRYSPHHARRIDAGLASHTDKEYIAKAIDKAIEYLSSVQLADGSFPGRDGQPDGEATLAVLDMMNAAGISLDDDRFVKNGNTVADGLRTFYIEGVGFVSKTEVESSVDGLSDIPSYENPVMDFSSAVSALTYLQAAENGKFGPDGKGNSVFEIVGSALTETPLGAILLAVVIVALLAFGMVRRYRRIKKEQ